MYQTDIWNSGKRQLTQEEFMDLHGKELTKREKENLGAQACIEEIIRYPFPEISEDDYDSYRAKLHCGLMFQFYVKDQTEELKMIQELKTENAKKNVRIRECIAYLENLKGDTERIKKDLTEILIGERS